MINLNIEQLIIDMHINITEEEIKKLNDDTKYIKEAITNKYRREVLVCNKQYNFQMDYKDNLLRLVVNGNIYVLSVLESKNVILYNLKKLIDLYLDKNNILYNVVKFNTMTITRLYDNESTNFNSTLLIDNDENVIYVEENDTFVRDIVRLFIEMYLIIENMDSNNPVPIIEVFKEKGILQKYKENYLKEYMRDVHNFYIGLNYNIHPFCIYRTFNIEEYDNDVMYDYFIFDEYEDKKDEHTESLRDIPIKREIYKVTSENHIADYNKILLDTFVSKMPDNFKFISNTYLLPELLDKYGLISELNPLIYNITNKHIKNVTIQYDNLDKQFTINKKKKFIVINKHQYSYVINSENTRMYLNFGIC